MVVLHHDAEVFGKIIRVGMTLFVGAYMSFNPSIVVVEDFDQFEAAANPDISSDILLLHVVELFVKLNELVDVNMSRLPGWDFKVFSR